MPVSSTLHIFLARSSGDGTAAFLGILFIAFLFFFLNALGKGFVFLTGEAVRLKNRIELTPAVIARYHGYLGGFAYYTDLDEPGRKKFIMRLAEFMSTKDFVGGDGFVITEKVKVLISASATQLLFGLDRYTLDYFNVIRVYPGIFYSRLMRVHMKGGTSMGGVIMFSWKDFEKGYEDGKDRINLGLHELAHALKIEVMKGDSYGHTMIEGLERWDLLTGPMLENVKKGGVPFLRSYAGTNAQEFWAVCIEHFFEAPDDFSRQLPNAYRFLCLLLRQDPLLHKKPMMSEAPVPGLTGVPPALKPSSVPAPVLLPGEKKTLLPPSPSVTRPAFGYEALTWACVTLILPVSFGIYGLTRYAAMTNAALAMTVLAFTGAGLFIFNRRRRRGGMNAFTYLFHSVVLCGLVGTLLVMLINQFTLGDSVTEKYRVVRWTVDREKEPEKQVELFLENEAYANVKNLRTVGYPPYGSERHIVYTFRTGAFGIKLRESWRFAE